jgi:mRNA-degrading endonuclease RelE of RelBE toxin-antitoxin system
MHQLKPEDLLTFVELPAFSFLWPKFNLTDEDLLVEQIRIMCDPKGHPVIPGSGGLRKLRFSPQGRDAGRRGGFRLCYVFFEEWKIVVLALVYPKSKKDDLSPDEKKRIKKAIADIRKELEE